MTSDKSTTVYSTVLCTCIHVQYYVLYGYCIGIDFYQNKTKNIAHGIILSPSGDYFVQSYHILASVCRCPDEHTWRA
jgi:hypothetical protein